MPYKSLAQEGLFHSADSPVGPEEVKKWDAATKGKHLPQKLKDGGVVANHSGPNQKVSKDWGVDLTKWAGKDSGSDMGKKGYEVDVSPAGQYDDAVRAEGNLANKAQMEAKRQSMVDEQGQPVQKFADGGPVQPAFKDDDFADAINKTHMPKVPGVGNRDTVPALLTPGEVVVPKKAAAKMFKPSNTWTTDEDEE